MCSRSFRLCVPGCSSRKASSSRSGLPSLPDGRRAGSFHAQPVGRRAQGIALTLHLLDHDEMLALERAQGLGGQRHLAFDIRGRERAAVEHPQDLHHGIFRRGVEQKLARGVAARVGQRIDFAAADVGRQRQHAAQHLAERRAVISRDPFAQREQFGVEHRLGVDQAQRFARLDAGRFVMASQDHAGKAAAAERHQYAAARLDAMAQRFRKGVSEGLVERDRQADVAV